MVCSNPFSVLQWEKSLGLVDYEQALKIMEQRVEAIHCHQGPELIWLLEHPPLYTAGSSAKAADLVMPNRFPVYETGRGGQYTYHGPGQRVAYVMIDLKKRQKDVRKFVWALEEWLIQALDVFHIQGQRRPGRVGIWVVHDGQDKKIAALGIRLRHWISFHGISFNVSPILEHFSGIVPCGLQGHGVTSLHELGVACALEDLDHALQQKWGKIPFLQVNSSNA